MAKALSLLGSTGSIGKNVLRIVDDHPGTFEIVALAARENLDLLEQQALRYRPRLVALYDKEKAALLQRRLPHLRVVAGLEGLCEAASHPAAERVVAAMVGAIGLLPTAAAIQAGKTIALANKEVLVAGGAYILPLARKHGSPLIPVDSEHNAIFQCLHREDPASVRRILLTSSGGPFREWSAEQLSQVTVAQALKHPNFVMGAKITVDSSTMMNKGLEVIEARWLFGTEAIEVWVHPQQKIHSLVEFIDGTLLAQMSEPDMRLPIQYALTYPERLAGPLPPYDFLSNPRLDFYPPDRKKFRCLDLAYAAMGEGGTMPCYMNAANEVLVQRFLKGEISWCSIGERLEELMARHTPLKELTLDLLLAVDSTARSEAYS